jgi:hypothetical protein
MRISSQCVLVPTMAETLLQLADLIQANTLRLKAAYNDACLLVPSLDDATQYPAPPQEDINQITSLIVSAAAQLIATITPPKTTLLETAMSVGRDSLSSTTSADPCEV